MFAKIHWKILLTRSLFWLIAEITLNCLGIDDLADYGEYVFERTPVSSASSLVTLI